MKKFLDAILSLALVAGLGFGGYYIVSHGTVIDQTTTYYNPEEQPAVTEEETEPENQNGIIFESEEVNNTEVNNSFHSKIYNRLGSTVRGPFDGGEIEWNRFERFTNAAKRLRTEYLVIASIYEDLAKMYSREAKRQDVESEIIMLDN